MQPSREKLFSRKVKQIQIRHDPFFDNKTTRSPRFKTFGFRNEEKLRINVYNPLVSYYKRIVEKAYVKKGRHV